VAAVEAELAAVLDEPARGVDAIVEARWIRVLGSQRVVQGQHAAADGGGELAREAVVGGGAADHEPAPVEVEQPGRRGGGVCGNVEPGVDRASTTGDGEIALLRHLGAAVVQRRDERLELPARRHRRQLPHGGGRRPRAHHRDQLLDLGVHPATSGTLEMGP
jgi:hypothetical protein